MKVVTLKDIIRKDLPIYYRRLYTAVAVLEVMNVQSEKRIEFNIETAPTGAKETKVNLIDTVDYPLLPVLKILREFIADMDKRGALP